MVERTFGEYSGSAERVAATIDAYHDAGMTLACVADLLPVFLPLDRCSNPLKATLNLCSQLKRQPA